MMSGRDGMRRSVRTGFGVEALDRDAHQAGPVKEPVEEFSVLGRAEEGVAKHAGGQGSESDTGLLLEGFGRFCWKGR